MVFQTGQHKQSTTLTRLNELRWGSLPKAMHKVLEHAKKQEIFLALEFRPDDSHWTGFGVSTTYCVPESDDTILFRFVRAEKLPVEIKVEQVTYIYNNSDDDSACNGTVKVEHGDASATQSLDGWDDDDVGYPKTKNALKRLSSSSIDSIAGDRSASSFEKIDTPSPRPVATLVTPSRSRIVQATQDSIGSPLLCMSSKRSGAPMGPLGKRRQLDG